MVSIQIFFVFFVLFLIFVFLFFCFFLFFFVFFRGATAGEDVGGPIKLVNLVNVYSNATCLDTDGCPCYLRQYIQVKECGSRTAGVILCCTQRADGVRQIYDLRRRVIPSVDHIVISQILH